MRAVFSVFVCDGRRARQGPKEMLAITLADATCHALLLRSFLLSLQGEVADAALRCLLLRYPPLPLARSIPVAASLARSASTSPGAAAPPSSFSSSTSRGADCLAAAAAACCCLPPFADMVCERSGKCLSMKHNACREGDEQPAIPLQRWDATELNERPLGRIVDRRDCPRTMRQAAARYAAINTLLTSSIDRSQRWMSPHSADRQQSLRWKCHWNRASQRQGRVAQEETVQSSISNLRRRGRIKLR